LSKEDKQHKPENNVLDNGKPIVRWGRKARGLKAKTAQLPKEHQMTKPLYLALLPVTLLACVEQNDNIYIESPCITVNVVINQDQDDNDIEPTWTKDLDDLALDGDMILENTENQEEKGEQPVIDGEELELHNVNLMISANNWEGWINGEYIGESNSDNVSELDFDLTPGHHVLAIRTKDMSSKMNGMIASVELEGESYSVTGDGQWLTNDQLPYQGWGFASYDDSSWNVGQICKSYNLLDEQTHSLVEEGAERIWHSSNCKRSFDSSWFRLHIIIE